MKLIPFDAGAAPSAALKSLPVVFAGAVLLALPSIALLFASRNAAWSRSLPVRELPSTSSRDAPCMTSAGRRVTRFG